MSERDITFGGDIRYFMEKFTATQLHPMGGIGFAVHNFKSESVLEGDESDAKVKDQYSFQYTESKNSVDLFAGLASQWTAELWVFGEYRFRILMDTKRNIDTLTGGIMTRL